MPITENVVDIALEAAKNVLRRKRLACDDLTPETPLLSTGLLSSTDFLEVLLILESKGFPNRHISPDAVDSIAQLVSKL